MEFEQRKEMINRKLEKFFSKQKYVSKDVEKIFERATEFVLRGGKRCRPALVLEGYEIGGGDKIDECVKASLLSELKHNFSLILDDIMDRGKMRRGGKSLHKVYEEDFDQWTALSLAINAGEYVNILSLKALAESDFPPEKKYKVIEEVIGSQFKAHQGQALDLVLRQTPLPEVEVSDILKMYRLKTASYTVTAPLKCGYILSPRSNGNIEKLEEYGKKIGTSFQIKDDLLELFGKEEIGKSITSDIEEGKRTLPIILAYQKGTEAQKEVINSILGGEASMKNVETIRKTVRKTGAKEKSEEMAKRRVKKGKESIKSIDSDFLNHFAEFVIERNY